MKSFNIELLKPNTGQLDALLFKNSFLNIAETLFYSIQIDLDAFTLENNLFETSISLNFIRLDISRLKELEGQTFTFPINPVDGYVDGSIYLFNVHNPFDVTKIEFNTIKNNSIDVTLYYDIDFEFENTVYSKVNDCTLKANLQFGELSIDRDILDTGNFHSDDAKKLVSKFISLDDLGKPEIVSGQVTLKMLPN